MLWWSRKYKTQISGKYCYDNIYHLWFTTMISTLRPTQKSSASKQTAYNRKKRLLTANKTTTTYTAVDITVYLFWAAARMFYIRIRQKRQHSTNGEN